MKRSLTAVLAVALLLGGFVLGLTSIASAQNEDDPATTKPEDETTTTTAPEETTPPTTVAPDTEEAPADETPQGPTPIDPEQFEAFRQCMAEHGVELPAPPEPGSGPPTGPPPRPDVDRETMRAAHEACQDLLPEGAHFGRGPGGPGGPGCNGGPGGPGGPGLGPRGDEDGTQDDGTGSGSSDTAPTTPGAQNSSFAGAV
jgi:hypothetical protein